MLKHRADIDGLRAVAVLMVVAFHAFPDALRGGFVGVDIFFVISGFVICRSIIESVEKGTFTFAHFYARRIRRIFPALIIVLACCLAFGWRVLLADEYRSLGEQAGAGALFASNILLWLQTGYFDADATLKPLLHLWSLGVEEQFYIVWPPVVLIAYRLRWNLALVAAVLALVSFGLNLHTIRTDPTGAFFLPHTRMWEPLIGCALAWLAYHRGEDGALPNVKAWAGAALITYAAVRLDSAAPFPGWWALLPTIGAALVIWAGPRAMLNRFVLSNRTMVWIGLISYPLYLWHWPLLSFAKICGGKIPDASERVELVVLSFVLAGLTYLIVEKRIRYRRTAAVPVALATLMLFVAGGSYATYSHDGYPDRTARFKKIEDAIGVWGYPGKNMTTTNVDGLRVLTRDSRAPGRVAFIGDSNMEMYWPRIDELISEGKASSAVFITQGGCPPIPGVTEAMHPSCAGWAAKAVDYAQAQDFDTVVIAADWMAYFIFEKTYEIGGEATRGEGASAAIASLQGAMTALRQSGKRVVLVLNIPVASSLNVRYLVGRSISGFRIDEGGVSRGSFDAPYGPVRQSLIDAAKASGASVIDPMDTLCQKGFCPAWYGAEGDPIYKDGEHISAAYARRHAMYLDKAIAADAP